MQEPRCDLFAGSGLSGNQYRQVVRGVTMDQVFGVLDRRRLAEHVVREPDAGPVAAPPALDPLQEIVHGEGLGHEVDGAATHQAHCLVNLGESGNEQEGWCVGLPGHLLEHGLAGHIRQSDVADH